MKNKNITSLIHTFLFIYCTTHVALWGSDDKTPLNKEITFNGFYPHQCTFTIEGNNLTSDLFAPVSEKEKGCLLHEKHTNAKTKNPIPGFVSPIASPQTSPEKIKPKEAGRGGRSRVLKPGLACNLFKVKNNDNDKAKELDYSTSAASIAATFNNDMPDNDKNILADHIFKYMLKSQSSHPIHTTIDEWHKQDAIINTIQKLAAFILETDTATKEFPRIFGKVITEWKETLGHLEDHNQQNCDQYSTGLLLLKNKFTSLEELNNKIEESKQNILFSYACQKELTSQESPRYKSED